MRAAQRRPSPAVLRRVPTTETVLTGHDEGAAGSVPYKPPRACRCGDLVPAGEHCARCYPPWASRPASWTGGSTRRWRRLRAAKLAADPLCQWPDCVRLADEVDHITPLGEGGDRWTWPNLQSLCSPHHAEKTRAEALRARYRRGGAPDHDRR